MCSKRICARARKRGREREKEEKSRNRDKEEDGVEGNEEEDAAGRAGWRGDTVNWIGDFSPNQHSPKRVGSLCLVSSLQNVHPHFSRQHAALAHVCSRFRLLRNSRVRDLSLASIVKARTRAWERILRLLFASDRCKRALTTYCHATKLDIKTTS